MKKGFLRRFELHSEVMVGSLAVEWSMMNEDLSEVVRRMEKEE